MRQFFAVLSSATAFVIWRVKGSSVCAQVAIRYGHACLFCRVVGFITREPDHCERQLTAADIFARLKRQNNRHLRERK